MSWSGTDLWSTNDSSVPTERFAVTQAKYLVVRMLQHYREIVPTDETGGKLKFESDGWWVDEVKYHVGLTMMPDAGVWLRLVPRDMGCA